MISIIKVEKIRKRNIPRQVAEQIINLIISGELKPGDKLPSEKQLEKMFGVSRPSIREALSALSMSEIIEMCHGEGSYVKNVEINNYIHPLAVKMLIQTGKVYELLETRLLIEPQIAGLAAKRAQKEELEELAKMIKDMEKEVLAGNLAQDEDTQFHLYLGKAAHNIILEEIMQNLAPLIRHHQMHTRQYSRFMPGRPLDVLEQHRSIYEAIRDGDSRKAKRFMQDHLEDVKRNCRHMESLIKST